jgi:death-on-curing protein
MVRYFGIKHAIREHKKIIKASWGKIAGVINTGPIESALDSIRIDEYCPTIEKKLTKIVYSVNKNHCFIDGNKRTSIALGAYFLEINDLGDYVGKFIRSMENISVLVADNLISREFLEEIIYSILNEVEFSEEIDLKLIRAYRKFIGLSSDDN